MPQPSDALDLRHAHESVLLDALGVGHPMALAEAYHRTVPAAHAVARRLVSGADAVEQLLLAVYTRLWTSPPTTGPLEGWVRRTTWALGVERLREDDAAPASPSAAGLVPDLPAPDVRFLDAAERAIAELPDDERRALLLAHDKGVPAAEQEAGAAEALTRALLALAGPETSGADRAAMQDDPCTDVEALGDWCLGVATAQDEAAVHGAIESRTGCAARSRAVRRGRRRIEGLPATPDMGQRVLVGVLTTTGAVATPAASSGAAAGAAAAGAGAGVAAGAAAAGAAQDGAAEDGADEPALDATQAMDLSELEDEQGYQDEAADPGATDPLGLAAASAAGAPADLGDDLDDGSGDEAEDPDAADVFREADEEEAAAPMAADPMATTGPLPRIGDVDPFAPAGESLDDPADPAGATDDLVASAPADEADDVDWRPEGSTSEMRLSDILAEGDDDEDDPFAAFDDEGGDPYSALRGLGGAGAGVEAPDEPVADPVYARDGDDDLVDGYVEGQEEEYVELEGRSGGMAAVLSWILPIIGGSLIGIVIAITVFGLP